MSLRTGCLRLTRLGVDPARRGGGAYTENSSLDDAFRPNTPVLLRARTMQNLGEMPWVNRVSAFDPMFVHYITQM